MKSNKRNQFIILLLSLLVVYYIFKVYIQDAVIFNAGSGNNGKGYFFPKPDSTTTITGALGATAIGLVKLCPPKTRPIIAVYIITCYTGGSIAYKMIDKRPSGGWWTGGGGTGSGSLIGGKGIDSSNTSGNSDKGINKSVVDNTLDIWIKIKEKVLGAPINCEGSSSWYPMDNINELLIGFSDEEKFYIGIIILLLGVVMITINIILSIIIRIIFSKPFSNKYLEKIRIWWSHSNNVTLIILLIIQLGGLISTIYLLSMYIGFINNR